MVVENQTQLQCQTYFSTLKEQPVKIKRNYMKIQETAGAALR